MKDGKLYIANTSANNILIIDGSTNIILFMGKIMDPTE